MDHERIVRRSMMRRTFERCKGADDPAWPKGVAYAHPQSVGVAEGKNPICAHKLMRDMSMMAKADRLARLDKRRLELEADYTAALVNALHVTASGKWGLFDHNGDRVARAAIAPVVDELKQLGQAIDQARDQLGIPPFELHQEFLSARGPVGSEAVGEPKQAKAWLDRLASTSG